MRLILVEKPDVANQISASLREKWPDQDLVILACTPITSMRVSSPRDLAYSNYPIVQSPAFKPNENRFGQDKYSHLYRYQNSEWVRSDLPSAMTAQILRDASEVILAPDWDYSGAFGFELLFQVLAPELAGCEFEVIKLTGGTSQSCMRKALGAMITSKDPEYLSMINAGRVKSYFDFNFAINSSPILGNLYRHVKGSNDPVFISKYALQVLWWMKDLGAVKNYKIEADMAHSWNGTGRYPKDLTIHTRGIGNAASRNAILQQLVSMELLEPRGERFAVSTFGEEFLSRLHKDTCDLDLPFRLDRWMTQPLDQVKPTIDRYLKTFFGKQKRHQGL